MDDQQRELQRINDRLTEIEKNTNKGNFFEKVMPVLATLFLGLAGIFISWNQIKISELQVELQVESHKVDSLHAATEITLQQNQGKVDLDRQYLELVYHDVLSPDESRRSAALKLVKKMRPDIALVFVEMFEEKPVTEAQHRDIEDVQVTYTNSITEKEKITIGIHRYNVVEGAQLSNIVDVLEGKEYEIIGNFDYDRRANWMANRSTVFYYGGEKSKQRAQSIANDLSGITGAEVNVQKGAGLGVDARRKNYHHFIHLIGV